MEKDYKIHGIRGATSIEEDNAAHISERVLELWKEIILNNDILRVISVIFSVTSDIKSLNPATVLRKKLNLNTIPFMCLTEPEFENSFSKIIRVLIICESSTQNFVYLHKASQLRQ
ncbi:MAG TPA: chorismate mutase [Defluviitoga sp.]|nr:chorismate mutase [Defluviitoga sp.]HOP24519.1 chorismate mutase [Defluviitoga sp.]HPZ29048.1 chorismate mutase [Defluviitoga sp.]HQD62939.1 chorismate mutase [Defluviitoga sp.]